MSRLTMLLKHFEIKTDVLGHGTLCWESLYKSERGKGHIHVIKKAPLKVILSGDEPLPVNESSILFFAHPTEHRFQTSAPEGSDMVCATVSIDSGPNNPLIMGFPNCLIIPMSKLGDLEAFSISFTSRHLKKGVKKRGFKLFDGLLNPSNLQICHSRGPHHL